MLSFQLMGELTQVFAENPLPSQFAYDEDCLSEGENQLPTQIGHGENPLQNNEVCVFV